MIEKIKYKEVEITTPEFVEHFMLLQKSLDSEIGSRWVCICINANIEWVNTNLKGQEETDKKWNYNFEYKILSIKLPA